MFDNINTMTGFANGAEFTSEAQVREYFTNANMLAMGLGALPDSDLSAWADEVIANRWHMKIYNPEDHDDRAEFLLDYTDLSRRERDALLADTRDCDSDWATVLEDPDADCGPSLQAWGRLLAAVEDTHND